MKLYNYTVSEKVLIRIGMGDFSTSNAYCFNGSNLNSVFNILNMLNFVVQDKIIKLVFINITFKSISWNLNNWQLEIVTDGSYVAGITLSYGWSFAMAIAAAVLQFVAVIFVILTRNANKPQ